MNTKACYLFFFNMTFMVLHNGGQTQARQWSCPFLHASATCTHIIHRLPRDQIENQLYTLNHFITRYLSQAFKFGNPKTDHLKMGNAQHSNSELVLDRESFGSFIQFTAKQIFFFFFLIWDPHSGNPRYGHLAKCLYLSSHQYMFTIIMLDGATRRRLIRTASCLVPFR